MHRGLDIQPVPVHILVTKNAIELAAAFGYLTEDEVLFLQDIAYDFNNKKAVIINIGAGSGTSGLALREAAPYAKVYTIDVSAGGPNGGLKNERNAFKKAELRAPRQIQGDSMKIGLEWENEVDMVFVDGDHMPSGIAGDFDAWVPLISVGGVIAFHDYGSNDWPAVMKTVDENIEDNFEFVGLVDTIIAFRRIE